MINKIKENKKTIGIALVSFYIIYKFFNTLMLVLAGAIILVVGLFAKDPELKEQKVKKTKLEQLTIFSDEVLEPAIIKSKLKSVETKTVLDIEDTKSYNFDEVDKKIKKSKKAKA